MEIDRQRLKKKWKKDGKMDEFDELNDEEPDLDGLYSDDEGTGSEQFTDDEIEFEPEVKKKKKSGTGSSNFDTEVLGEMLDNTGSTEAQKKQEKWEQNRTGSNFNSKRKRPIKQNQKSKGTGSHPNKNRKKFKKK